MGVSSCAVLASSGGRPARRVVVERHRWPMDLPLHYGVLSQMDAGSGGPLASSGWWLRRAPETKREKGNDWPTNIFSAHWLGDLRKYHWSLEMVEQKNNLAFHIQTDIHARNFKKREHSYPQELSTMAAVTQKKIAKVVVVNMNGKEIYQGPATQAAWRWLISSGYVLSVDNAVQTRTLWKNALMNALKSEESNDVVVSAVLQDSLLTRVGYALGRSNGERYKRVEVLDKDNVYFKSCFDNNKPPTTTDDHDSLAGAWKAGYAQGFADGSSWYNLKHNETCEVADKRCPRRFADPFE